MADSPVNPTEQDKPKGVLLPSYTPRWLPLLKAVAAVTLFAFTFTSIIPAGYAQQPPPAVVEKEHLRGEQVDQAPPLKAGLEDALKTSVPGTDVSTGLTRRQFGQMTAAAFVASLIRISLTPEVAVSQELPERVRTELRQFLNARRITGTKPVIPANLVRVPEGFQGLDFNGLYTEYEPRGKQELPLTQFGRIWPYGNALVLQALTALYRAELAAGRKEAAAQARTEALGLLNALVRLGRAEEALGFEGGYHFSYNTNGDNFIHPVAPTGNTLWVVGALSYAMRELGDDTHLEWVNSLMERLLARLQVNNPKDLRDGLLQAGFYTYDNREKPRRNPRTKQAFEVDDRDYIDGMAYHVYLGNSNRILEDIATEHQFDAMFAIADLIRTNEAAREGARGRLTGKRLDRLVGAYRRLAENVNKLWVTDEKNDHFVTGMEKVGKEWRLNRSVAVDNNSWALMILPHNEEMAWKALEYVQSNFIVGEGEGERRRPGQRIGDMQDLPPATRARMLLKVGDPNRIDPDERVAGVFFFARDFMDRFIRALVPAGDPGRALWPRMIHPEATYGYIQFLRRFAEVTRDAGRRKTALDRAQQLTRGMQRVQELYGGKLPNTTGSRNNRESNDPPPLYSTLNAITPAATAWNVALNSRFLMPELPKVLRGIRITPRKAGIEEGTAAGGVTFWAGRAAGVEQIQGSASPLTDAIYKGKLNRRQFLTRSIGGVVFIGGVAYVANKFGVLEPFWAQPADAPPVLANRLYRFLTGDGRLIVFNPGEPMPVFTPSMFPIRDLAIVEPPTLPAALRRLAGVVTEVSPVVGANHVGVDVTRLEEDWVGLTSTAHRPLLPVERELPKLIEARLREGQLLVQELATDRIEPATWEAARNAARWVAPAGTGLTLTLHDAETLDHLRDSGDFGASQVAGLVNALGEVKKTMRPGQELGIAREIHDLVTGRGHEGFTSRQAQVPVRTRRTIDELRAKGIKTWAMGSGTDWVRSPASFEPGVNHLLTALDMKLFDPERLYLDLEIWTTPEWTEAVKNGERGTLKTLATLWLSFHEEEVLKKVVPGQMVGVMDRGKWGQTQVYTFVPKSEDPTKPDFEEILREVVAERGGRPVHPRIHLVPMAYRYPEGREQEAIQASINAAGGRRSEVAVNMTPSADPDLSRKSAAQIQQILQRVTGAGSVILNVREALALIQLARDGQLSGIQRLRMDQATVGTAAEAAAAAARQAAGLPAEASVWEQQQRPVPVPTGEETRRFAQSGGMGLFWGILGLAPLFHLPNTLIQWLRGEFGFHPDNFPSGPEGGTLLKIIGHVLGVLANGRVMVERSDIVIWEVDEQGNKIPGTDKIHNNILAVNSPGIYPSGRYRGEVRLTLKRTQLPPERVREALRERLGRAPTDAEVEAKVRELDWGGALTVSMSTQVAKGHQASGDTPREQWDTIIIPAGQDTHVAVLKIPELDPGPNWITHRVFDINGEVAELLGSGTNLSLTAQFARALAEFHSLWLDSRQQELAQTEPRVREALRQRLGREPNTQELEDGLRWDLRVARQILQMNEMAIRTGGKGDVIARVPFSEVEGALRKSRALREFEAQFETRDRRLPNDEDFRAAERLDLLAERAGLARRREAVELQFAVMKLSGVTAISVQIPQAMQREFWEWMQLRDQGIPRHEEEVGHQIRDLSQISHQFGIRLGLEVDAPYFQTLMALPESQRWEQIVRDRRLAREMLPEVLRVEIDANEKGNWNLDFMSLRLPPAANEVQRRDAQRFRNKMEIFFEGRDMDLVVIGPQGEGAVSNWRAQYAAEAANLAEIDRHFDTVQSEKPDRQRHAHAVVISGPRDGSLRSLIQWLEGMPRLGRGTEAERDALKTQYKERLRVPTKATLEKLGVRDPAVIRRIQNRARTATHRELKQALDRSEHWAVATVQALADEAGQSAGVHMVDRFGTLFDRGRLQANGVRQMPLIFTRSERPDVKPLVPPLLFRVPGQATWLEVLIKNMGNKVADYDVYLMVSHPYRAEEPSGPNNWPGAIRLVNSVRLLPGQQVPVGWELRDLPQTPDDVEFRVVVLPRGSELLRPGMPASVVTDERALARFSGRIVSTPLADLDRIEWIKAATEIRSNFLEREQRSRRLGYEVSRRPEDRLRELNAYAAPFVEYRLRTREEELGGEDEEFPIRTILVGERPQLQIHRSAWVALPRRVAEVRERILQSQREVGLQFYEQIPQQPASAGMQRLNKATQWGLVVAGAVGLGALAAAWKTAQTSIRRKREAQARRERQDAKLARAQSQTPPPTPAGVEERVMPVRPLDITKLHSVAVGGFGFQAITAPIGEHPEYGKVEKGLQRTNKGHIGVANDETQKLSENIDRKPVTTHMGLRKKFFSAITSSVAAVIALAFWLTGSSGATTLLGFSVPTTLVLGVPVATVLVAGGVAAVGVAVVLGVWWLLARSPKAQAAIGWLLDRPGTITHNPRLNQIFSYASALIFPGLALLALFGLGLPATGMVSITLLPAVFDLWAAVTVTLELLPTLFIAAAVFVGIGTYFSGTWESPSLERLARTIGSIGLAVLGTVFILKLAALGLSVGWWVVLFWGAALIIGILTVHFMTRLEGEPLPLAAMSNMVFGMAGFLLKWGTIIAAVALVITTLNPLLIGLWGGLVAGVAADLTSWAVFGFMGLMSAVVLMYRFELGYTQIQQLGWGKWQTLAARAVMALMGGAVLALVLPAAMALLGIPATFGGILIGVAILSIALYMVNKAVTALNLPPTFGTFLRVGAAVALGAAGVVGLFHIAPLVAGISIWLMAAAIFAAIVAIPAAMVAILDTGASDGSSAGAGWHAARLAGIVGVMAGLYGLTLLGAGGVIAAGVLALLAAILLMVLLLDGRNGQRFGARAEAWWQISLISAPLGLTFGLFFAAAVGGVAGAVTLAVWMTYIFYIIMPGLLGMSALNTYVFQPARFWVQHQFEKEEERDRTLRYAISYLHGIAGMQGIASPATEPPGDLDRATLETLFNDLTTALNLVDRRAEILKQFNRRRRAPSEEPQQYELYDPSVFRQAWISAKANAAHHVESVETAGALDPANFPDPGIELLNEDQQRLVNWYYWKLQSVREAIQHPRMTGRPPVGTPDQWNAEFDNAADQANLSSADRLNLLDHFLAEHLKAHADTIFGQDDGTTARTFWHGFWTGKFRPVLSRFRNDDRLEVIMPALILSFGWDTDYSVELSGVKKDGTSVPGWNRWRGFSAWVLMPLEILRVALLSYAVPIGFFASMVNRNLRSTFQPGNTMSTMVVSADAGVQGYLRILGWVVKVMGRWLEGHIGYMIRALLGKKVVESVEEALDSHRAIAKHGTLRRHVRRLLEQARAASDPGEQRLLLTAAYQASLRAGGAHPVNDHFTEGKGVVPARFYRDGWTTKQEEYWGDEFNKGLDVVAIRFDRNMGGTSIYVPTGFELDENGKLRERLTNHPERLALEMPSAEGGKDQLANAGLSYLDGFLNTEPVFLDAPDADGNRIQIRVVSMEQKMFPELEGVREEIRRQEGAFREGTERDEGVRAAKQILHQMDRREVIRRRLSRVTATVRSKTGTDGYDSVWGQRWLLFKSFASWVRDIFLGFRTDESGRQNTRFWRAWGWLITIPAGIGILVTMANWPLALLVAAGPALFGAVWGDLTALSFFGFIKDPRLQGMKGHYDPRMLDGAMQELFGSRADGEKLREDITLPEYEALLREGLGLIASDPGLRILIRDYPALIHPEHPLYKHLWFIPGNIHALRYARRMDRRDKILQRLEALIGARPAGEQAHLWRAVREAVTHNTEMELMAVGNRLGEALANGSHSPDVYRGGEDNSPFGKTVAERIMFERMMELLNVPVLEPTGDRTWQRRSIGARLGAARIPSLADEEVEQAVLKVLRMDNVERDKQMEKLGLDKKLRDQLVKTYGKKDLQARANKFAQLLTDPALRSTVLGILTTNDLKTARELIANRRLPIEAYFDRANKEETPSEYAIAKTHLQPDIETTAEFLIEESKLAAKDLPDFLTPERHNHYLTMKEIREGKRDAQGRWIVGDDVEPYIRIASNLDLRQLKARVAEHGTIRLTEHGSWLRGISDWFGWHPIAADAMSYVSWPSAIAAGIVLLFVGPGLAAGILGVLGAPAILHAAAGIVGWLWQAASNTWWNHEPYSSEAVTLQLLFGAVESQVIRSKLPGRAVIDLEDSSLDGLFDASEWTFTFGSYAFPGTTAGRLPLGTRGGTKAKARPVPFLVAVRLLEEPDGLAQASGFNWLPTDAFRIAKPAEDTDFGHNNDHTPRGNPTMNASNIQKKPALEGKLELRKKNKSTIRAIQLFKGMAMEEAARHLFDHPIFDNYRSREEAKTLQRLFGWDPDSRAPSGMAIYGMQAFLNDEVELGGARYGAGTFLYGYTGFTGTQLYGIRVGPFSLGEKEAYWVYRAYALANERYEGNLFRTIRGMQQELQDQLEPALPLSDEFEPPALLQSRLIDPFIALARMAANRTMQQARAPPTAAGVEEIGQYIDDWVSYNEVERAELVRQWMELQVQSDRPLNEVARYAKDPKGFSQPSRVTIPDLFSLPKEAFSAPKTTDLPMDVADWFSGADPSEVFKMRDLLNNTVFVMLSGGGGTRFKDGVREVPVYQRDLEAAGRFEKPTAILHVSGKSPQVRSLEALEKVSRLLGAKPKLVIVDSEEASKAVRKDLQENAPWLFTTPNIEMHFGTTIVYPSFHQGSRKVITYRDPKSGQPRIVSSPNGTFGAYQAAWKEIGSRDLRYFIVHGDSPVLFTPPFLLAVLRQVAQSDRGADYLEIATKKRNLFNPVGGTVMNVRVADTTLHLNVQPSQREREDEKDKTKKIRAEGLDEAEKANPGFFPFDTGCCYLSEQLMEAAVTGGVPLNQSENRPMDIPGKGKIKAFLPEQYGTDPILYTNDPDMSLQVIRLPLDGAVASSYRATKLYRDKPEFGLQGVWDSVGFLEARDVAILKQVFSALGAEDRLELDSMVSVEISSRVTGIQVGPQGALRVNGPVGIEFSFEGIRARRFLGWYSPGQPRWSRDYVEILPAQPDGTIVIDREIVVDSKAVEAQLVSEAYEAGRQRILDLKGSVDSSSRIQFLNSFEWEQPTSLAMIGTSIKISGPVSVTVEKGRLIVQKLGGGGEPVGPVAVLFQAPAGQAVIIPPGTQISPALLEGTPQVSTEETGSPLERTEKALAELVKQQTEAKVVPALADAQTKSYPGTPYVLTYNPSRRVNIVGDATQPGERPCPLCPQNWVEGEEGYLQGQNLIAVNIRPITAGSLVSSLASHQPQNLTPEILRDMVVRSGGSDTDPAIAEALRLIKKLQQMKAEKQEGFAGLNIIVTGPGIYRGIYGDAGVGASIPEHAHAHAIPRPLPIEAADLDVAFESGQVRVGFVKDWAGPVIAVRSAGVGIYIGSKATHKVSPPMPEDPKAFVALSKEERDQSGRFLLVPGALEIGGEFITPDDSTFERAGPEVFRQIIQGALTPKEKIEPILRESAGLEERTGQETSLVTQTAAPSPVSTTATGVTAPVISTETRVTRMTRDWHLNELPEVRVVVLSSKVAKGQEADGHPELAGLMGKPPVQLGNAWLMVLPEQATPGEISDLLVPIAMDLSGKPVRVWEYFSGEKDNVLKVFDQVVRSPELGYPVTEMQAEGTLFRDLLRQIIVNLRGLRDGPVREEEIQLLEETIRFV